MPVIEYKQQCQRDDYREEICTPGWMGYDERRYMRMNLANISNETILGKVIRLPLKVVSPSATVRILQGPLRGKRWIAGSTIHGCWLGTFEFDKQKLIAAAIKPGSVVYDLGAHVGFYSLLAGIQAGPEGKVFCFEP